ncbi:MAG: chloramphenicol phosphotransferase, partial [Chlamydiia bacterium]|nr:chloramphenicol phosphotransferase [Chlamydiia bacterium]
MRHGKIIYLNGPSSVGKSSLAKDLQTALNEPYLHIGIDRLIGMMPEKINDWSGQEPQSPPQGFSWQTAEDENG